MISLNTTVAVFVMQCQPAIIGQATAGTPATVPLKDDEAASLAFRFGLRNFSLRGGEVVYLLPLAFASVLFFLTEGFSHRSCIA